MKELENILFLDIETASIVSSFLELGPRFKAEWERKVKHFKEEGDRTIEELFFEKAGIFAEFGKVICIGVGYFVLNEGKDKVQFRTKSFSSEDEYSILDSFGELLGKKKWTLC